MAMRMPMPGYGCGYVGPQLESALPLPLALPLALPYCIGNAIGIGICLTLGSVY